MKFSAGFFLFFSIISNSVIADVTEYDFEIIIFEDTSGRYANSEQWTHELINEDRSPDEAKRNPGQSHRNPGQSNRRTSRIPLRFIRATGDTGVSDAGADKSPRSAFPLAEAGQSLVFWPESPLLWLAYLPEPQGFRAIPEESTTYRVHDRPRNPGVSVLTQG
jgi:hypothetical protein